MSRPLDPMLVDLCTVFRNDDDFLLCSHANPDGDAIGSLLGMAHLLRALGKKVTPFVPDPLPESLRFLPGVATLVESLESREFNWLVLMDCATPDRVHDAFAGARWRRSIVIDHHLTERNFGDIAYVDRHAAATGEMILRVARALGWSPNADFATCIYTAICTDTGSFRFSNTTPAVLQAAADLASWGAHPHQIAEELYENQSLRRIRVMAEVLSGLEIHSGGRVALTAVRQQLLQRHEAGKEDLEGLIDVSRSIRGVVAAAQIRETKPNAEFRVSLRSKGSVDVEAVARAFGGGGHRHASGCTLSGDFDTVRKQLLHALAQAVAEAGNSP